MNETASYGRVRELALAYRNAHGPAARALYAEELVAAILGSQDEPVRPWIFAGNHQQAVDYAFDHALGREGVDWYHLDSRNMRGRSNLTVIRVGTWMERKDRPEIEAMLSVSHATYVDADAQARSLADG